MLRSSCLFCCALTAATQKVVAVVFRLEAVDLRHEDHRQKVVRLAVAGFHQNHQAAVVTPSVNHLRLTQHPHQHQTGHRRMDGMLINQVISKHKLLIKELI